MPRTFLTAQWRHLLMANYVVDPRLLAPHLPQGVELDLYEGEALVSLVGFRFLDTRVLGVPIPGHRNFDELNLRFYVVRRQEGEPPRRGVCFIREFVPRFAIAFVARTLYDEPYSAVPMRHEVIHGASSERAAYAVKVARAWHILQGTPVGPAVLATDDPAISFITEHYWGYTKRGGRTAEYEVRHPVWQARRVADAKFAGDPGAVYGAKWRSVLSGPAHSAFLADGSPVEVLSGQLM